MHWNDLWQAANATGAKLAPHIVHNWGAAAVTAGATKDGFPVVVSAGYYLDNDEPWTSMHAAHLAKPTPRNCFWGSRNIHYRDSLYRIFLGPG
jgi:hypothetical protein